MRHIDNIINVFDGKYTVFQRQWYCFLNHFFSSSHFQVETILELVFAITECGYRRFVESVLVTWISTMYIDTVHAVLGRSQRTIFDNQSDREGQAGTANSEFDFLCWYRYRAGVVKLFRRGIFSTNILFQHWLYCCWLKAVIDKQSLRYSDDLRFFHWKTCGKCVDAKCITVKDKTNRYKNTLYITKEIEFQSELKQSYPMPSLSDNRASRWDSRNF